MMKRTWALLFILLYLATVPGLAANLRYCSKTCPAKINAPATSPSGSVACKINNCRKKRAESKVKVEGESAAPSFFKRFFIFQVSILPVADFFDFETGF
jgi:hypothetical protein